MGFYKYSKNETISRWIVWIVDNKLCNFLQITKQIFLVFSEDNEKEIYIYAYQKLMHNDRMDLQH